jgi:hypothetical protein
MAGRPDQTIEVPAVIHLRGGPGVKVACGGPDGLWTRDLLQVNCSACHAALLATRPIPAAGEPAAAERHRKGR